VRLGDRYQQAATLTRLGDTHRSAGDLDEARASWHRAVTVLDGLRHPDARAVHERLAASMKAK
jgi:hypothetical protein